LSVLDVSRYFTTSRGLAAAWRADGGRRARSAITSIPPEHPTAHGRHPSSCLIAACCPNRTLYRSDVRSRRPLPGATPAASPRRRTPPPPGTPDFFHTYPATVLAKPGPMSMLDPSGCSGGPIGIITEIAMAATLLQAHTCRRIASYGPSHNRLRSRLIVASDTPNSFAMRFCTPQFQPPNSRSSITTSMRRMAAWSWRSLL